jgi:hypothetical protein
MEDIICRCGHILIAHEGLHYERCRSFKDVAMARPCYCRKYSPDNLLYIEKLAQQKGLV